MRQDLFVCPRCRTTLDRVAPDRLTCPKDGLEFWNVDGIWRFLLPESQAHYSRFLAEHEALQRAEERGSTSADYYRLLPFKDLSGRHAADWALRRRSFKVLVNQVLTKLQNPLERSLRILDLGAGNGWLANRLSAQGDRVLAVDLSVNARDGLGAWRHYEHQFTPVQADFNHLPVMDRFADAVIFNASFHYSENYADTLQEALRVLTRQGRIVIMDSPVYRRSAAGEEMVRRQKEDYREKYRIAFDSLESENYVTYDRLKELSQALNIQWKLLKPFYGIGFLFRPLIATLLRRPGPARFPVIVGKRIG